MVSLFTNIPINFATNSLNSSWEFIKHHTDLPKQEFMKAIFLILNSIFFTFNNQYYRQTSIFGTLMGSPLSPIIANLVLQELETLALKKFTFISTFYFRYIDDIALTVPTAKLTELIEIFNSFHLRLQFTLEMGSVTLNFLDFTLINKGGNLIFFSI